MTEHGAGPEVGSLAEEAAKLLGVLSGWADEHFPDLDGVAERTSTFGRDVHEHLATGAPECTYCPVCRLLRSVRQSSPEVRAHLTAAAGSLLQAAAAVLASHPPAEPAGDPVQHIPVDEDWPEADGAEQDWPEADGPEHHRPEGERP